MVQNRASLATKIAVAHNTSVKTATGSIPFDVVSDQKLWNWLCLKLGLFREESKLCHSDVCEGLPPHSHETSQTNTSFDRLTSKIFSRSLFTRGNQFKPLYADTYRVSQETTEKAIE